MKNSIGYKKLLESVQNDELKSPGFHDYMGKLKWVLERAKHYSEKTGISESFILDKWESERSYWYMNYYKDSNQPLLDNDNVKVFESMEELHLAVGSKGFRCPACGGITKNPYTCDSGIVVKDIKDGKKRACNWKVYGLFGGLGEDVFVFVKEKCSGNKIFMPVEWENTPKNNT